MRFPKSDVHQWWYGVCSSQEQPGSLHPSIQQKLKFSNPNLLLLVPISLLMIGLDEFILQIDISNGSLVWKYFVGVHYSLWIEHLRLSLCRYQTNFIFKDKFFKVLNIVYSSLLGIQTCLPNKYLAILPDLIVTKGIETPHLWL